MRYVFSTILLLPPLAPAGGQQKSNEVDREQKIALLREKLKEATRIEALFKVRIDGGLKDAQLDYLAARYQRLDAEFKLVTETMPQGSPSGPKAKKLLEDMHTTAKAELTYLTNMLNAGLAGPSRILTAWDRALQAGLKAKDTPKERIVMLKECLKEIAPIVDLLKRQADAGVANAASAYQSARAFRLDVEKLLLNEQKK